MNPYDLACPYDNGDGSCAGCAPDGRACTGNGPTTRLEGGELTVEGFADGSVPAADYSIFMEAFEELAHVGIHRTRGRWDGERWTAEAVDQPE